MPRKTLNTISDGVDVGRVMSKLPHDSTRPPQKLFCAVATELTGMRVESGVSCWLVLSSIQCSVPDE